MKKLLIVLAILSCNVMAKEYAIAPNKVGGWTILTKDVCKTDANLKQAYSTNNEDKIIGKACWKIDYDKVVFKTQSGDTRQMSLKMFDIIYD